MIDLRGFYGFGFMALIIAIIVGYFAGKNKGKGYGIVAGFLTLIAVTMLPFYCKPCGQALKKMGIIDVSGGDKPAWIQ